MNYYEILGVPRTSSDKEIKSSYRRLVKKFHPDKNPSEEARKIISQINEAYDVLSDPIKRATYDQRENFVYSEIVYKEDPREAYRREYLRKKRETEKIKKEEEKILKEKYILFEKNLFRILWVVHAPTLLFAMLLNLDYYLPPVTFVEVAEMGWQERISNELVSYMKTKSFTFVVPSHVHVNYEYYGEKSPLYLQITPIFKTVKTISIEHKGEMYSYETRETIHTTQIHPPAILLLVSLISVCKKQYSKLNFNISICTFVLLVITILKMTDPFG